MRAIVLYGPTTDQHGRWRDAGERLSVGAAGDDKADLTAAQADKLVAAGTAVTPTRAREDEGAVDPLDHDANGRKGGSLPTPD